MFGWVNVDQGAVLVTGASSGIGRAIATTLAEHGYRVFAGVRRASDGKELERLHRGLQSVILDVTDTTTLADVAELLEGELGEQGLAGLVNNAGIAQVGPLEYLPEEHWRRQLDVNVLGTVAVTRVMLSLIRRGGGGRILFVGSIGGRLAPPLLGPYCASKYALEGLTEALRHELRPSRIPVVLLVPGSVRTDIWEKTREQVDELSTHLPAGGVDCYQGFLDQMSASVDQAERTGLSVDVVARAVLRAMKAAKPRPRYLIGAEAHAVEFLTRVLPSTVKNAVVSRVAGFPSHAAVPDRPR
jgi:NAD(P)-dependent dehydrogenase (short-subunit alcohol dehydrogenase family)